MKQYSKDLDRFTELLSKYTDISKSKINNFLDYNNVSAIFEHPASLSPKAEHVKKINELKVLRNLYLNLKSQDIEYVLNSSSTAGEYFVNYFMDFKDKEKFVCSFLDSRNKVIATSVIFEGTVNLAPVFPREILKKAISYDAISMILSHNHPGGSTSPSEEDIATTDKVIKALSSVDVKVLDHIVVAGDRYTSLAEKGLIRTYEEINNKVVEGKAKYRIKGTKKRRISKDIQL